MPRRPLVIAHRGASAAATDNTLEAFALAAEQGADLIELDVRRLGDGALVAFHDPDVAGRRLRELSHEELDALAGYHAPTLDEVLDLAADRVGLDVELKEDDDVERIVAAVAERFPAERVIVTSFLAAAVRRTRATWPAVTAGLLLDEHRAADARDAVAQARACDAGAVAVSHRLVLRDGLAWTREAGLPAYVWTVDDHDDLAALLASGDVAGVITNVPDRAVAIRARTA